MIQLFQAGKISYFLSSEEGTQGLFLSQQIEERLLVLSERLYNNWKENK